MAISASQITTANTLEQLRGEFNNLCVDVTGLEAGTATFTAITATTSTTTTVNVAEDGSLISTEKMFEGDFGRIRTAQIGPDGILYLLTANGDNDKIIRISEAPLDDVEKFTSSESGDNLTILYVIIGIVVVGVTVGVIVIKRRR